MRSMLPASRPTACAPETRPALPFLSWGRALGLSLLMGTMGSTAHAAPAITKEPSTNKVELSQSLPTTMEELAAVDVLREICPALLPSQQQPAFWQGMTALLKQLMPNLSNPLLALDSLKSDSSYQKLYQQASADAHAVKVTDNRAVCTDILSYTKKR